MESCRVSLCADGCASEMATTGPTTNILEFARGGLLAGTAGMSSLPAWEVQKKSGAFDGTKAGIRGKQWGVDPGCGSGGRRQYFRMPKHSDPNRLLRGKLNLTIHPEIRNYADELSRKRRRSVSQLFEDLIEAEWQRQQVPQPKPASAPAPAQQYYMPQQPYYQPAQPPQPH